MELNKIYNENCLDTMKRMPDNFIDLTVTSPPYDNLRDYNGYSFPFEDIAKELYRVTKEGGVVVWVVGDATVNGSETGTSFKQALFFKECGFNIHDTMLYHKSPTYPPRNDDNRYGQAFEYMFVFSKGKLKSANLIIDRKNKWAGTSSFGTTTERLKNGEIKDRGSKVIKETSARWNIWKYNKGFGFSSSDKNAYKHPAIFPEKLASDHIYSWSNEGDIIYDPFMGSGTTAKAAHIYKRNWIGSEISEEYVELAYKRLKPYLTQTTLF